MSTTDSQDDQCAAQRWQWFDPVPALRLALRELLDAIPRTAYADANHYDHVLLAGAIHTARFVLAHTAPEDQ